MIGFAILLGFYFLGSLLHNGLQLPLPANVIGLILFTLSLFFRIVKLEWVEETSRFLINHMLLLFAPIVVGTMVFFGLIGREAFTILISLFASTFGVLLITGWTARLAGGRKHEGRGREYDSQ